MEQAITLLKATLPIIATICFCMLPHTFKNSTLFGVKLSDEQVQEKNVITIKRIYQLSTAFAGFIPTCANLYCIFFKNRIISDIATVLAMIAILIFAIIFYMMAAKAIAGFKEHSVRIHDVGKDDSNARSTTPLPISFTEGSLCPSLWWYLLHILIIIFCLATIYTTYNEITPYVSLWCDFNGHSVLIAQKSMRVLSIPVILQILITLICFYISLKIKHAPLILNGISAKAELEKNRKSRTLWSVFLYVLALGADICAYAYINFMFLLPEYKAFAAITAFSFVLIMLAALLIMAHITSKNRRL